jgi:hypothetical protein
MNKNEQNGSVLILVLIGTLILSLLGVMGLDQTTTEIAISRNFVADKTALFCAETGIQFGINELRNTVDPLTVKVNLSESSSHFSRAFKSATVKTGRLSDSIPQYVNGFTAFTPPPPPGVSLEIGGEAAVTLTAWELIVSSIVQNVSRGEARKQVNSVVVLLSSEY